MNKLLIAGLLISSATLCPAQIQEEASHSLRDTLCMFFVVAPKRTLKKATKITTSIAHHIGHDIKDVGNQIKDSFK